MLQGVLRGSCWFKHATFVMPFAVVSDDFRLSNHLGDGGASLLGGERSDQAGQLASQPLQQQQLLLPRQCIQRRLCHSSTFIQPNGARCGPLWTK